MKIFTPTTVPEGLMLLYGFILGGFLSITLIAQTDVDIGRLGFIYYILFAIFIIAGTWWNIQQIEN